VVDLEEPRNLRPTIGWPESGAMQNPAYQLLRVPLLGTDVKIRPPGGASSIKSLMFVL
jgi:hypothetical protein